MVYNKSKAKGTRAEADLVKLLKTDTKLNWMRTPLSGALDEAHGLKADIYIPNEKNFWAVEVKHYKDDHLTSKLLTSKDPMLLQWWSQALRQAEQTSKKPLLAFKFDRSKWFIMLLEEDAGGYQDCKRSMFLQPENAIICEYSEFKAHIMPYITWIK